jgi:hypothetical protein
MNPTELGWARDFLGMVSAGGWLGAGEIPGGQALFQHTEDHVAAYVVPESRLDGGGAHGWGTCVCE